MEQSIEPHYLRYTNDAVRLLGIMIHNSRVEQNMTVIDVAKMAGISRGLVHRIESGNANCSIGSVFKLAAIVGVSLFEVNPPTLPRHLAMAQNKLTLLPKNVRKNTMTVKDCF